MHLSKVATTYKELRKIIWAVSSSKCSRCCLHLLILYQESMQKVHIINLSQPISLLARPKSDVCNLIHEDTDS